MSTDVCVQPMGPRVEKPRRTRREVIYRHTFLVRVNHWINAVVIFLMIGSGLNIFGAHPRLYWGEKGDAFDPAVASIGARMGPHGALHGVTRIGAKAFDTTGVLGASMSHGHMVGLAWPSWLILADARHWHFFFAWVLILNGAAYLAWSLAIRHIQRDLWPTRTDLKTIPRSIWEHMRNRHPTGEEAKRYNVLQKLAYLGLIALAAGPFRRPAIGAHAALPVRFGRRPVHLHPRGRGVPGGPGQRDPLDRHRQLPRACRPPGQGEPHRKAWLRWRCSRAVPRWRAG